MLFVELNVVESYTKIYINENVAYLTEYLTDLKNIY